MTQAIDHVYAQALWEAVEGGMTPEKAVAGMHESLVRHNRLALMPRILRSFRRVADTELRRRRARITVAREKDIKQAMIEAKVTEADVCVDDTLIGGWRLETRDTLIDASYKKYLSDMFIKATR